MKLNTTILVFSAVMLMFVSCEQPAPVTEFDIREYYFDKCAQFVDENRIVEPGQIVFVGDSITDHGQQNLYYRNLPLGYYNRGISGDTVWGLTGRMDISIYNLEPALVVFLMGINDIYLGQTNEQLYEAWGEVFAGINDNCSNTKVIVHSLYPIDASNADGSDAAVNIRIETVNAVLKSKTESYGYRYVDLFSQMVVPGTLRMKTEYVSDGVHPNDEGKKFIASVIEPIIIEMLD